MNDEAYRRFLRSVSDFFILDGQLWRKQTSSRHQIVILPARRLGLIKQAHDDLGHKMYFMVRNRMRDRFWWPSIDNDIKWYLRTCHICQTRQLQKVIIPPTVPEPARLFRCVHIDTMHMPKASGYSLIVHARCSLSGYPEARPLRRQTARTLGAFIFEEILCRWGAVEEIITDNGAPYVKALDYLGEKYGIHNIRISPYNSRANGVIERAHRDFREALIKSVDGNESRWPPAIPTTLWAERVTIKRYTKMSPYFIAHRIEPLFPFDLAEATHLVPPQGERLSTSDLLAIRSRQLQKREEDLAQICARVWEARQQSVADFIKANEANIVDYDFQQDDLVLVRNS